MGIEGIWANDAFMEKNCLPMAARRRSERVSNSKSASDQAHPFGPVQQCANSAQRAS